MRKNCRFFQSVRTSSNPQILKSSNPQILKSLDPQIQYHRPMTTKVSSEVSLKDPKLFRQACYIDGAWLEGREGIDVDNPATGEIVGTVPKLGRSETRRPIEAAARAFPHGRRT